MNIISSSYVSVVQKDGRRDVHEVHTDLAGVTHDVHSLAGPNDNLDILLASHADDLGINLELDEVKANVYGVKTLGSEFSPTFLYSTVAENLVAGRAAYIGSTRIEAVMIGDFLSGLTNPQLQNIFSMTAGQVTTLRANKLTPAASAATAIRNAAGQ